MCVIKTAQIEDEFPARGPVSGHLRTLIHVSIFNITNQLKSTAAGSNDRTYDSADYTDEASYRKSGSSGRRFITY